MQFWKIGDNGALPIVSLFNNQQNQKKNYQRFQTVDLLNTFWDPLTYNVAKG